MTAFYQIEVTCEVQAYAIQQLIQSTLRRASRANLVHPDDKTNAALAAQINYVGDDSDWELRKSDLFGR